MVVVVFLHSDPYRRTLRTLLSEILILVSKLRPVDPQTGLSVVKTSLALLILVLIPCRHLFAILHNLHLPPVDCDQILGRDILAQD